MSDRLKTWAVVELMGHSVLAGHVSEQEVAGNMLLRIDVPETEGSTGFTKFVSTAAIYGITPCDQETVIAKLKESGLTPFSTFSVRQSILKELQQEGRLLDQPKSCRNDDFEEYGLPL